MTVTVVNQWAGSWAPTAGSSVINASTEVFRVSVANTGGTGNWMIAFWGLRQVPGLNPVTCAIGDDACNFWHPLGSPNGTSSTAGVTRAGIWAARGPAAATTVFAPLTGTAAAACLIVIEMTGLPPWESLEAIATAYANDATSLSGLSLPAPPGEIAAFTVCANDGGETASPGGGWTALTAESVTDGYDDLGTLTVQASWRVNSGAVSAPWSAGGASDMSGVIASVLLSQAAPVPASATFPMINFECAFGSGAGTPWDELTWTDLTTRYQGMSSQRGKQYELDAIQAGTVTLTLSNNDGALTPGYGGSPYGPRVYTPVRILATWPPPPSASAVTSVVFRGFMERWPQALTGARYQISAAVATDVWALLTSLAQTVARAEILADSPWAYWPLGDPAGNTTAQNIAPGSAAALNVTAATAGSAGTPAFGTSTTLTLAAGGQSTLAGDPGGSCWSQAGLGAGETTQGWTLQMAGVAGPSTATGITVECWFAVTDGTQPDGNLTLLTIGGPAGQIFELHFDTSGNLNAGLWNSTTRAVTAVRLVPPGLADGSWFHVAVTLTQNIQVVYVNGLAIPDTPYTEMGADWYSLSLNGQSNRWASGGMFNGSVYGAAVFGAVLPATRIATHYLSALTALAGTDTADQRLERLVLESGLGYPRCLTASADTIQGAVDQQQQQLATNLVNIAESDSGLLFVDAGGYIRYVSRPAGYNLTPAGTFGEATAGGENPYLADIAFDYDPSQLYNDIQLTQLSAPQAANGADVSAVVTPSDAALVTASIAQYGDQTLQETVYLYSAAVIGDLANWIFWTNGTPAIRVSTLTLDAGANPALWPVVLSVEVGQVYTVNRRLMGTQLIITGVFQVMSVAHTTGGRSWTTKLGLVAYPGTVLTADDPVRGQLTGSNVLGF